MHTHWHVPLLSFFFFFLQHWLRDRNFHSNSIRNWQRHSHRDKYPLKHRNNHAY
jgi:hypothetical protein